MGESWEGGVIVGGQERRVVWIDRGRTDWCIGNASKSIYSLLRSAAKNNMKDDNHSDSEIRFSSVLFSSFGFVEKKYIRLFYFLFFWSTIMNFWYMIKYFSRVWLRHLSCNTLTTLEAQGFYKTQRHSLVSNRILHFVLMNTAWIIFQYFNLKMCFDCCR